MTLEEFVRRFPVTHRKICAFINISHTWEIKVRDKKNTIKPYRKRMIMLKAQKRIREYGITLANIPFDVDVIKDTLQKGPISLTKLSLMMDKGKNFVVFALSQGTTEEKREVYEQLKAIGKAMMYIDIDDYNDHDELASMMIGMK